jgi:hypothetical protein
MDVFVASWSDAFINGTKSDPFIHGSIKSGQLAILTDDMF